MSLFIFFPIKINSMKTHTSGQEIRSCYLGQGPEDHFLEKHLENVECSFIQTAMVNDRNLLAKFMWSFKDTGLSPLWDKNFCHCGQNFSN